LYIFGESYAGHYVPAFASYVVAMNQQKSFQVNLQGMGVGNGFTDPLVQYKVYGAFSEAVGLVGPNVVKQCNALYQQCAAAINNSQWVQAFGVCNQILGTIEEEAKYNFNYYNYPQQCTYAPLCYNFNPLQTLMNLPAVQTALGTTGHSWQTCVSNVYGYLEGDWARNLAVNIPPVLAAHVRVLIYSGKLDWICNYWGGGNWTAALSWPGQAGFNNATLQNWLVNGTVAAQTKSYMNFTWLQVEGAGHMVPMDQPVVALTMLKTFLLNSVFVPQQQQQQQQMPPNVFAGNNKKKQAK